jgi:hypothetical protein
MSRILAPPSFPGALPGVPGNIPIQPVVMLNQPPPGIDPFMAILYSQFLAGKVWLEYFAFSASWTPLAASASGASAQTTIDAGIDFIVQQMNLTAYNTDDTYEATPSLLLEVQETSGRANWSDQPIPVGNWCGNTRGGNMSYWLPTPRYVRGSNTINWKLTNRAATAYDVDLAILGMRVTYTGISREELFKVPY